MGIEAALIMGGAALAGSAVSGIAAKSAAQTQANAADQASQLQYNMWQTQNAQQAPYREAGYTALKDIQAQLPSLNKPFTAADLNSQLSPNYEFMKQQGLGAISQTANVGGGGSNINMARTKFAEDYASNAYQQAFSNYQSQQNNIYNRLANLAGIGQASQNVSSQLAANTASNIGQATIGGAQAQAAGTIGASQAISGGLQGVSNAYLMNSFMNPSYGTSGYGTGAFNSIPASAISGNSSFIGPPA